MEPTIKCGKHLALHAKLTGSRFEDVCLGDAEFENVSRGGSGGPALSGEKAEAV